MLKNKMLDSQLLLNWVARILFFTSLSALLPTFPVYIHDLGGSKSQIGVVMSAFAIGVLAFRPVVGKQIDSTGRRLVLLAGCLIFMIAPILYIYIPSIEILLPLRVFHGLGLAAFGTASITLITDAAPATRRADVISYTGMVNTIAFAFGPILGSFVGNRWGHTVLFSLVSALAFLCLACSLFIKETRGSHEQEAKLNYFQAIKQRIVLVAFAMILLIGLVHGGVIFYISIFLNENMEINEGVFFAVYGGAAFLVRMVVGPVSGRIGRGPLMVVSLAMLATAAFCLSQMTGLALMLTSAVLYGLGFGAHQPNLTALVADNTSEETRGKIFSFYFGGFDLGISIAGIILGIVAEAYGLRSMFFLCGALTLTSLAIFTTSMEKNVMHSLRSAFTLQKPGKKCYICDQYQEVSPRQAEEYFKTK